MSEEILKDLGRVIEKHKDKVFCTGELNYVDMAKSCKLEIERLNNKLQQKENIIKEVREYIENHLYMESTGGIQHPTFDGKMNSDTDGFEILEILDKGE